jgi:hypothetical protein
VRPCDKDLVEAEIDVMVLKEFEGNKIIWLERFLTEREQLRLVLVADILLIPSADLHSVTIMQGLAAGAVPVVTDVLGANQFVKDGKTGVVLKGVREAIREGDASSGVPANRHARFAMLTSRLATDMYAAITTLLDEGGRLLAMQEAGRADACTRFRGAAFVEQFEEAVCDLWDKYSLDNTTSSKQSRFFLNKGLLLDESRHAQIFDSAPEPRVLLETPDAYVYRIRRTCVTVQKPNNISVLANTSVLGLRECREFRQARISVGTCFMDVSGVLFPMERGSRAVEVLRAVEAFAYARLRKYPRLYAPLKKSYNSIRRVSRMMNTPPSGEYKSVLDWAETTLAHIDRKQTWTKRGVLHGLNWIRMWRNHAMRRAGLGRATYRLARLPLIGMRKMYWVIGHYTRRARSRKRSRGGGI